MKNRITLTVHRFQTETDAPIEHGFHLIFNSVRFNSQHESMQLPIQNVHLVPREWLHQYSQDRVNNKLQTTQNWTPGIVEYIINYWTMKRNNRIEQKNEKYWSLDLIYNIWMHEALLRWNEWKNVTGLCHHQSRGIFTRDEINKFKFQFTTCRERELQFKPQPWFTQKHENNWLLF